MALARAFVIVAGTAAAAAVAGAGWFLLRGPAEVRPLPSSEGPGVEGTGEASAKAVPAPAAGGAAAKGAPAVEDGDPDDESDLDRDPAGETGGATAEEILAALARGDAQGWLDAARLLSIAGSSDPRVTDALLKAMADDRWRIKAAEMAKDLKDPAALARFLELARADGNENTRAAALMACAAMGGAGVHEAAVELMRSARPGSILAATAAGALGTLGTPDAARVLVESLREALGTPRQGTFLEALGRIHDPEAIGILTAMATDAGTDPTMRVALVTALGRTQDPAVVNTLLDIARGESPDALKFEAYRALARVGSPEAVGALLDVLHGGENQQKAEVASALQQITGKGAAPLLEQSLDKSMPPELRSYVIDALARIASKTSVAPLAKIASDASQPVGDRTASIRALGAIGDPAAAVPSLDILEKEPRGDPAMRMAALGTLSRTATAADIPRIEALLAAATKGSPEWIHLDAILKSLKAGRSSSLFE